MPAEQMITVDGNEAVARVAYRLNEVAAIYPITPSSVMGELADDWAVHKRENLWGTVPSIVEMQSEGGAIGAIHGALQAGSLATTFTASQGLLLMIPNMYKIAGELNAFCMHVAARTVATHALSIFGDHSDVMGCRQTGFAMLASGSVQEAQDHAAIAQAATLASRVPFLHFFDGFRTSHEVAKIHPLPDDVLRKLIKPEWVAEHRARALTPDAPKVRGTAQNPDTFFQAREACNPFYDVCPQIVQEQMDRFAEMTGRQYHLFDYVGHPKAERVVVMMGSGAETAHKTISEMVHLGEKVGLIKVRLYRPFSVEHFIAAMPHTARRVAVLDRTKEPGSIGEPLYLDIVAADYDAKRDPFPAIVGGRYGLSSKEFTPAHVKAVLDNLASDKPRNHFTVGITDDVTHLSLPVDEDVVIMPKGVTRALFYGMGADGTVGANKNTIKIIGESTDFYAQGYFVYDSKKSGAMTVSHLRFGPEPIRAAYLILGAGFVACHQFTLLDTVDVLKSAEPGAVFLLNAPYGPEKVWDHLPAEVQQQIIEKRLRFYVIDGYAVADKAGMGRRINTVMQTCFFAISGVLPREEAISKIKAAIEKTYAKRGEEVVRRNFDAVDQSLEHLHEVKVPSQVTSTLVRPPIVPDEAPDFVKRVTAAMMAGHGDGLPVSAFPPDGVWPTGTSRFEKRNIAPQVPVWDPDVCIQCNKCALVCPHAAIRCKVYEPDQLTDAPTTFMSADYKAPDFKGLRYTLQVATEDCTGCTLCVAVCPAKNKAIPKRKAVNMAERDGQETRVRERADYDFFLNIPEVDPMKIKRLDAKGSQFLLPMFEYSGACAGCGETPYIKLLTQLYGDRLVIANATGCSSIYGGNLPTTPYCTNEDGRGPAWSNSLFEDNAEFGLGMRVAIDQHQRQAHDLLTELGPQLDAGLVRELLSSYPDDADGTVEQRGRVIQLREALAKIDSPPARRLDQVADYLVRKAVWLVGGDGWAYDIGYGGLDHVLSLRRDVNVLVLDTEVYSNTGGQQSKATPLGAAAKFAAAGKSVHKKDLGLMAMSYGHVYVASIAMGANDNHTVKVMQEAGSYPGPTLIIAYSHCIAHGYDLSHGLDQQKRAVASGIWPLYRFDPRRVAQGLPALQLDSKPPSIPVHEYMSQETRFRMVEKIDPERFRHLAKAAQRHALQRVQLYQHLAALSLDDVKDNGQFDKTTPAHRASSR
jgi:pyruvate-ferredoxin/flavodoxin oxidoreductase